MLKSTLNLNENHESNKIAKKQMKNVLCKLQKKKTQK